MSFLHAELASGRWRTFSLMEQLANVGSEVERALNWKDKGREDYSSQAFERALELMFLTIDDPKNRGRLRELTRLHEVLRDYFLGENQYCSTADSWRRYFSAYGHATALERERARMGATTPAQR